jgi:hypothetical protein
LATHHGEPELLEHSLRLAPLLAAAARSEGVGSVEAAAVAVCRDDNGPVVRLRVLENALRAVVETARELPLELACEGFDAVALPEFGVDALLLAEVSISLLAERGRKTTHDIMMALRVLEAEMQGCLHEIHEAKSSGAHAIKVAQEQGIQERKRAQQIIREQFEVPLSIATREKKGVEHAYRLAEGDLRTKEAEAAGPRRRLAAYNNLYDSNGKLRLDVQNRPPSDVDVLCDWHHSRFAADYVEPEYIPTVLNWAKRHPYFSEDIGFRSIPFQEIVLHMMEEGGDELRDGVRDEIQSEALQAEQAVEKSRASVKKAHKSLQLSTERVQQAQLRKAGGDSDQILRQAELSADSKYRRVVQEVEEAVPER